MCGVVEGAEQGGEGVGIAVGPALAHPQYFLGAPRPDSGLDRGNAAGAGIDRRAVPGLADAIAVDTAGGECVGHQRRRQDDDLDRPVRIDAARGEPIAQLVIVPRMRVDHAEAQFARRAVDHLRERPAHRARGEIIGGARRLHALPEVTAHRHRIAAKPQRHRRHRRHGDRRQP